MIQNRVGVIGYPIDHSLSPVMHNGAFQYLGMDDWLYDAMAIPPDIVRYGILEPKRHGYIGVNVTVPHKEAVMGVVRPDEKAQAIGAVNTIDFRADVGTNTDADGFIADLRANDVDIEGQKVLVLGAGGAARAAVYGLSLAGADIVLVNRTLTRAQDLIRSLKASANIESVSVMTLDESAEWQPDLIVNCTSVGMHPHIHLSPWISGVPFPQGVTVYDMVYRPANTALMQQAVGQGGRAIGGLGMLVRQGAIAFELWTGVQPPIDVMFEAAQSALEKGETK